MLDITKNRSSYQRLPILKQQQKCKQTNVQLVPNVTKLNSYATRAAAASNFNVAAAAAAVAAAAATTTTTTKTTTASTKTAATITTIRKQEINYKKSSGSTNATTTTPTTTTNKVRAANQLFFLTQEYKYPHFLKKECESAQAQLYIHGTPKKAQRSTTLDDKRNNNNNNGSSNNNSKNNSRKSSPSSTLLPTIINGMRQTGQSNYMGHQHQHQQQQQQVAKNTTATTITVHTKSEQYKVLPKTSKSLALNTTAAATPYSTNKLNSRQITVRPLVHRTIPAAALAAANALTAVNCNNNYNKQNYLNNNNNNNMENACNRLALNSNNEADDIKYIDSDELVANAVVARKTATTSKSRIRPKSTIICSATNLVFEKMNNYKMAAAASNNSLTVGAIPARQNIDTSSIKASIEKFNSFSEQKRLPNNVALRTHAASGSNSNLQQQHRHSSDFDNCNIRLPAGTSNSLTRSPFRAIPHTTANSSNAVPTSKVITSMHATASAARAAALSNSLPTKSSGMSSMRSKQQEQAPRGSTSSLLVKDAQSTPMYKNIIVKQASEAGQECMKPVETTAGGNLENVAHKKKVIINNGVDTESDSVSASEVAPLSSALGV